MEEKLKELAARFIAITAAEIGVGLRYDEESVEWVEGYIERIRSSVGEDSVVPISNLIGSFLGECVIANYGGHWREMDGSWGVCFDEQNCVFPFAKVQKQFISGRGGGDSILGFYTIIPVIFKDSINAT